MDARPSRGLRFVDEIRFSSLDAKLAVRMLVKHAGLSLVAVFGMAIAMTIGIISFASSGLDPAQTTILLVASPLILILTGFVAALGPARRGLAIQPSEALRTE